MKVVGGGKDGCATVFQVANGRVRIIGPQHDLYPTTIFMRNDPVFRPGRFGSTKLNFL